MNRGELRTLAKQRADMENGDFCSTTEINNYINSSYQELYDLLVQKFGSDYYVATVHTFSTDGTNDAYDLPNDFYKLLGVDVEIGGEWKTVRKFNFAQRNRAIGAGSPGLYGRTNMRYRLRGDKLWLMPLPSASQSMRMWYIPKLTVLGSGDDSVDIKGINGWEEYIIVDVARKMKQKEETDTAPLVLEKQALIVRIESAAANRDAGEPEKVNDVLTMDDDFFPDDGLSG